MTAKLKVSDCLCFNLRKTSRMLTQSFDQALRPAGIRITQFTLMATVAEMGESPFVPLAAFLGMDRTTLGRNLDVLAGDGLVQIAPGAVDRRQQIVRLTAKGSETLAAATPLWEQAQREALQRLGEGGLAPFLSQLAGLVEIP